MRVSTTQRVVFFLGFFLGGKFCRSNSSITVSLMTEAICLHAELLPWLRQSALLPGECPLQRGGGSDGHTLWEPHIAHRLATGSVCVVWPSNFARPGSRRKKHGKHQRLTWNIMEAPYQPPPECAVVFFCKDQQRGKVSSQPESGIHRNPVSS